ncbi:MAG: ferritin-like domain-containing protein [Bacteroidota bacterium]
MNIFNIIDQIEKVDPEVYDRLDSRRNMFSKGSKFVGNLALAAVPFALGSMFNKAYGKSDLITDTLNFALTLEYLESEFYNEGVGALLLIPAGDKAIFNQIAKHENQHVSFLKAAITGAGGTPVAKPTFDFSGGSGSGTGPYANYNTNYQTFLALSQAFEDTGVRAYKGQAGNLIASNDVLTAALQIHSVEARHAAMVRRLRAQKGWITGNETSGIVGVEAVYNGEENTNQGGVTVSNTQAFDEPLSKETVTAIASLFIKP